MDQTSDKNWPLIAQLREPFDWNSPLDAARKAALMQDAADKLVAAQSMLRRAQERGELSPDEAALSASVPQPAESVAEVLDGLLRRLAELSNRYMGTVEDYYLHGIWKARDEIENLRASVSVPGTQFEPDDKLRAEVAKAIDEYPLIASLLYDINLLPEQIKDERRYNYMLAVINHMRQAINGSSVPGGARVAVKNLHPVVHEAIDQYAKYYAEHHKLGLSVRDDMRYIAQVAVRWSGVQRGDT